MGWVVNATPRPLYHWERPCTHCIRDWVEPMAGMDGCGKSRLQPGFDPWIFQPVASRYTDWRLIHTHIKYKIIHLNFTITSKFTNIISQIIMICLLTVMLFRWIVVYLMCGVAFIRRTKNALFLLLIFYQKLYICKTVEIFMLFLPSRISKYSLSRSIYSIYIIFYVLLLWSTHPFHL